jgi:DNA-binding winged helix-turn-helix (wHTH) protein
MQGTQMMAMDTDWINDSSEALILFGPFRVLPKQRVLMRADKPVHLGGRAFDVLIALLERPGELISKEELMAKVWPNTFVGPANLAVHISALRRALGDGHDGNRYVVNIHGRGYRFVAAVTIVEDPPRPIERTLMAQDSAAQLPPGYLLTLVGLAGGKTSMKFALVPETIRMSQDGVWLVNLNTVEEQ